MRRTVTAPARILSIIALWLACFSGTLQLQWEPVTTQCDGTQENMGTYEITLRKCSGDTLRLPPIGAQFTAADISILGGTMGVAELRAIDAAGNRSCGYQSYAFAMPLDTIVPPTPPTPPSDGTGIVGRYYRGLNRNVFVGSRRDSTVNFQWALDAPMVGVPADSFSVEWDGQVYIPTAGAWTFYVTSEDGIQLYIDWTHTINAYVVQPPTERSVTATLVAGWHGLHLNYMARLGNAECALRWQGPGIPKQVIPRGALR